MHLDLHHRAVAAVLVTLAAVLGVAWPVGSTAGAAERPGALVRIPYAADTGRLTPYSFKTGYELLTLAYDTLLWRDERGVPRPWLARAVRVSPDGRRLSITLARGARWHDGVALTADDVAFTLAYMRRNFHPRFTPQLRAIERVTVTGRHSLVIGLRRPSPGFEDQPLADVPIMPRHLWARLAPFTVPPGLPIGSGPYRITADGDGIHRFVANRRYFLGTPAVDVIQTRSYASDRETTRALEGRRADLALLQYTFGSEGLLDRENVAIRTGPLYAGQTLMFNLRRPPFDDPRLRRGIAHALDLPRIARAQAGTANSIEPAEQGLLHPRSPWASGDVLHRFDLAAARRELAPLRDRPLRVLAVRPRLPGRSPGRAVAAALRRAGVRATLVETTPRRLAAAVGQDRSGEDFELAIGDLPSLVSHDPDYLRSLFGRRGPLNYAGYRSAQFERLAQRVATARPARARRAAVAAELRLLARDLPVVPLYFPQLAFEYRRAAWSGWRFIAGEGLIDKRSFFRAPARPPLAAAGAPASDGARIGPLGFVAIGLFGLALTIVLVGSQRRRR